MDTGLIDLLARFPPAELALAAANETARRRVSSLRADPAVFRDHLLIDRGGGRTGLLGKVAEPWQQQDFEAMDDAWRSIVGLPTLGKPIYRAYLERPRGHSKTTDTAANTTWALFSCPRKLIGVAAASDQEQAKLLRDGIDTILRLNTWLGEVIKVNQYKVKNIKTGSELSILASDDVSAFGHVVDFAIADELTHWKHEGMWTAIASTVAKRDPCLFVVISNAGHGRGIPQEDSKEEIGGQWQWKVREACRTLPSWYFHRLDGPQASWINEATLAEQRALTSVKDYARLWLNQWQTEGGEGLSMQDVLACCVRSGPLTSGDGYCALVGGLDLAQTHDHAAFAVLACDTARRKVVLAHLQRWKPEDFGGRISLKAVETDVLATCKQLGVTGIAYDPYQCERTAEELRESGIKMFRYEFNAKHCHEMASAVLNAFRLREVEIFRDPSFLVQLQRVQIISRALGYKLDAPKDEESGHCDEVTAFSIALPWANGTMLDY